MIKIKEKIFLFIATMFCIIFSCMNVFAQSEKENPVANYYHDFIVLSDGRVVEVKEDYTILFINGAVVTDYETIINKDRTLAPISLIDQKLNASVTYSINEKKITIVKDNINIEMYIDMKTAFVNDIKINLDCEPIIHNETVYIPLRFVAENLEMTVNYALSLNEAYEYYFDTHMPVSPADTIIRNFPNIIIDEKNISEKAASQNEALEDSKKMCLLGLENFKKSLTENLKNSGEPIDRFDSDLESIRIEINRMLYLGEVSKYYKFTIGPYDILYDKYNHEMFFIIYSSGIIVKKVDINDNNLFMPIFIVG